MDLIKSRSFHTGACLSCGEFVKLVTLLFYTNSNTGVLFVEEEPQVLGVYRNNFLLSPVKTIVVISL